MKKLITLVLAAAASMPLCAETIFTADLNTLEGFQQWTVVDANNDGKTWTFSDSNDEGSRVFYTYHSTNSANDWLISPAITPETDGSLMVRYTLAGSYYSENAQVYSGNAATADAMTTLLGDHPNLNGDDHGYFVIVDGKAGEPIHFGVKATSNPDKWRLYLKSFTVETVGKVIDLAVTEIVSPVTGRDITDPQTVTVKVANNGLETVESFNLSFLVNDELCATETVNTTIEAGAEIEYTFNAKADLSIPRELYTVTAEVSVEGDIEASNNSISTQVRHIAAATVPYFTGFEPTEYLEDFKSFNLNNDSGDWEIGVGSGWFSMARSGVGFLGYNYDKNNNADDWMIMEPIKVEPGYYALKFWYSGDDNHPEKFAVYYGSECSPEAMTNKIVEYAPFARGAYEESISIMHFDEAQTIYIGFYAFSDKDENWITIDDLSIERIESSDIDLAVSGLSNPGAYLPVQASHDVIFNIKNLGIAQVSGTVTVKLDDTEIYNKVVTFGAQEDKAITIEKALESAIEGNHTISIEVACEGDSNADNNSLTHSFRLLTGSDILYDFENAVVPEDFTFEVNDEGTLDPSAVAEFGETGWNIVSLGSHPYYGTKMLGASSWVNGVDQIDRSCLLPEVAVNADDACFVWNAGSMSPYFYESYQIRAWYEDPYWGRSYSTLAEVTIEGTDRMNRGVELGRFKGQNVQIEIRMISKSGDAISFDNLQFRGCTKPSVGVNAISSKNGLALKVAGNKVIAGEVADITVVDTNGRTVAAAKGSSIDLSQLASGIYIVKASTATASATTKVVR